MSKKLLCGLLVSAALLAPGAALADPPDNWGQCVKDQNADARDEVDYRGTKFVKKMFDERDSCIKYGLFPGEEKPAWDQDKHPHDSAK
jgi:hypothetical protein